MHRIMSLSTILMNAAGVSIAVLFAMAAGSMPHFATRSGSIYAGVLLLATFASERVRRHVIVDDPDHSPPCCATAMRVSRLLLATAWVTMIGLLAWVGVSGTP
jgi:sugar/nucleoside kinase (ribokinase family)